MKKYDLVLITENQKTINKAKSLAQIICKELNTNKQCNITKYDKFDNSYKIEIKDLVLNTSNTIEQLIKLTSNICSPWLVTYDNEQDKIELIFNKTEFSTYQKDLFNVIKWARVY